MRRQTKQPKTKEKNEKLENTDNGSVNGVNGDVGSEDGEGVETEDELRDEEREKLLRVLVGELEDLPPLGSKIVRIFTSSTFTDTTMERNALMENVYPKLKSSLREKYGLEFQVVDMRWGVRDEATDDHMTTSLCMQEIDNCQRLSIGPNFIVFLGQKYGYRPIPTHIDADEFNMLRDCIQNEADELELIDVWYRRDYNTIPAVYILQPISSILTNFNNKRKKRLMETDRKTWWDILGRLQRILRKAAQVLFIAKKFDREQMHNYFMSVTEREITRGILKAKNVKDHCLAYVREIENINITLLRFAEKFIKFVDISDRNVDGDAQKMLKTLRDDKLPAKMPDSNIVRFKVEWGGKEGIDIKIHKEYIETFCQHFYSNVLRLVDDAMTKNEKLSTNSVYVEVLQHLKACYNSCKVFQGREDMVTMIQQYVLGKLGKSDKPLILFGDSGCGKTSLMAKGSSQARSWFSKNSSPFLVLRFLGTTPNSSSIIPLLKSLCQQLTWLYEIPDEYIPDELSPLVQHFKKLLTYASKEKPLVLILDSLDQLSGAHGAHQLAWLPTTLPPNVRLIVSTLPNYYGILDTLRNMTEIPENYIEVLPLGENLSATILKFWLKNANRTLTEEQRGLVNEAFTKCNLPLYVKLVFDEVCRWKSYTALQNISLALNIHDSIYKLFERIEIQHGKTLVSHALGYITAAKSGLSEAELEDLLSLDEKVLNDVYQYHLPPVRRIPPLLWTRIRSDLPSYLSEREADGANVVNWYHRQFIEAAKQRYFKNLNYASEIHSNIAEYFLGMWGGGKPKPFEYTESQRKMFHLEQKGCKKDRKVPSQPLLFADESGNQLRHNLRKLNELPYHLVRSHRYEELYCQVIFNYNWLHAKLNSMPLQSVLSDFEDLLDHVYQKDVKLIADVIRLSSSILGHCPDNLGPQIIGRLLPYFTINENIRSLIQQCDTDGLTRCALVPVHHCLHTPGGPLQFSLEGHLSAPFGIVVTSNAKYLISVSNTFIIFDLSTGEVFRTIAPGIEGIMQSLVVSENDKFAAGFTNNNQVIVCNILTGEHVKIMPPLKVQKESTVLGTTMNNTHLVIWTEHEWFLYTISGRFLSRHTIEMSMPIISSDFGPDGRLYIVVKSGGPNDNDMTLEMSDNSIEPFEFHSAISISKDKQIMYTCTEKSDNFVAVYKRDGAVWRYDKTLGDNFDMVLALNLSEDEKFLVATIALGYKLWNLKTDVMVPLKLPHGTRNNLTKNTLNGLVTLTRNNHFVVAAVRKNLYVWDVKQGNMVKVLDAHFGRIIALTAVTHGCNKIISSSIDKTIKVWNFDNILEDVHSIDRLEKPIETIDIASEVPICVTTSRNCVGVWNLENGKLLKTFGTTASTSVITEAVITGDGNYVCASETANIVMWDVSKDAAVKVKTLPQIDTQKLIRNEFDTRIIAIGKLGDTKGSVVCYSLPEGDQIYKFEYGLRVFKNGIITCDGSFLALPAVDKSGDVIGVYHAKTGTHFYNFQLKYATYKPLIKLIPMPHDPNQVALIDEDKGNILDLKKKTLVRSVTRWNGQVTKTGKNGLYAPSRGGLEYLELKHGKTVKTLIKKVAEGVFSVDVMFSKNDRHVVYYHSGHRTLRVFRLSDGKMVAKYKAQAEVKVLTCSPGGMSVIIGCVDGSMTVLALADPFYEENISFLKAIPSRQRHQIGIGQVSGDKKCDSTTPKNSIGTAFQVARFVAKARGAQGSGACIQS
ncbi:NACHT and WD repeat domain-containing protein 2-like [Ruditapes philippinarum]|uniref:NACHT and WD repeat domain-containing protein 2-like n=1 Tax=Ruditapes philippinarum TaxID=129788 RepID=UPI00295B702C|nr:NACHT and WD repeat domain-containing protein 2-like [Ruditapes philippinarum]